MKQARHLLYTILVATTVIFSSCKKDDTNDPNAPIITLSSDKLTGKSGQELSVTVSLKAPNGIASLLISKGVNLKTDSSFGTNGTLKVAGATGNTFEYIFKYILSPNEVDKLVGFNFKVTDNAGKSSEKDFTLNTTVSGAQLLYSYRWNLKSKMWLKNPPEENIEQCAKDDSYLFNTDSTMVYAFGTNACTFDGFNVYDKWSLSADEKELTIIYHSLFDPSNITTEKYKVITLTRDKLVLDITYDLTVFGLSDKELFEFTYESSPR